MSSDSYPDFETLCRLCLQAEAATVNIFTSDAANNQLSIPVRIMACAALEVLPGDELPKSVCAECRYQLEKSYYFRKRCQLSDSKLKKHIRLLNLGKKSRIFSRTQEENFEDELEFEDSLSFLKEQDAERLKIEQSKEEQWKETIKEELKVKIIDEYKEELIVSCKSELRAEVEDDVRNELRSSVQDEVKRKLRNAVRLEVKNELRKEVRQEVKDELRDEVIEDVRENLKLEVREECLEQAKVELRDEVKEECREEEIETILGEINDFLNHKRSRKQSHQTKESQSSDDLEDGTIVDSKEGSNNEISCTKKAEKRPSETLLIRKGQKMKLELQTTGTSDNEISSSEQTLSFVAVQSGEGTEETDSNYYILEDEDDSAEPEEQENNVYFSQEGVNFQLTASESSENGTTYQIEENRDIQFFKKEDDTKPERDECDGEPEENEEDVLIFDPDYEQEDSLEQLVEFVDIEKKPILIGKLASKIKLGTNSSAKDDTVKNSTSITVTTPKSEASSKDVGQVIVRTNDVTKTFQCPECPQLFTTETSMMRHLTMHRKLEQKGVSYDCPICHILLSCKSALNRHMLKHSGRRPFVCEECGKSFIQREILKRHLLTHSGIRPYECPHCDRSFTQKLNLTQHINKCHTANPKLQQYSCHMCPKRFIYASGLSRHLPTHSGVAFQCTECERTFSDRSSVKRHIVHVHGIGSIEKTQPMIKNENRKDESSAEKDSENSADYII